MVPDIAPLMRRENDDQGMKGLLNGIIILSSEVAK